MSLITHNWRLKLLSIFLVGITWGAVAYGSNPPTSQVRRVPVETGPAPTGLVPLTEPPPILVTVVGLQASINNFKTESLRASVDLAGTHKGHNLVRVRVQNTDSHVTVQYPSTIDIFLDSVVSLSRKVTVNVTGSPSSCCVADKPATANPDTVTLTGPESLLADAVASVTVDISNLAADFQTPNPVPIKVELPTRKGTSSTKITSNPPRVSVKVPIDRVKLEARLPILAPIYTGLQSGYRVVREDISPTTVLIDGDQDIVSTISAIDTESVDLSGRTSDVTLTMTLLLPTKVTLSSANPPASRFTVRFVIQAQPGVSPAPSPSATP